MNRVKRHREIIHCLLEEYRALYADADNPQVETLIIRDDENGQYQLMRVGWRGEKRLRRPVFYVRLKNGKIWIEEDWTQASIASQIPPRERRGLVPKRQPKPLIETIGRPTVRPVS